MEEGKTKPTFNMCLIQLKITPDMYANLKRAEEMIDSAVTLYKPNIIVLPEFFNCPLGIGVAADYAEEEGSSKTLELLKSLAIKYSIYIIGGSFPIKEGDKVYNKNFNFNRNGEIVSTYCKNHLFDVNIPGKMVYQESAKISPGNSFGVFDTEYGRIGIGICYDIRFIEYALLLKKEYKCDMLVYPAAFNTTTGPLHWDLLARSRAMDTQSYVVMCSPARSDSGYPVWGYSMVVDPFGQILTQTGYQEDIVNCKIDLNKNDDIASQIPVWKQKKYGDLYDLVKLK
jgi:omega-amidase